MTTETFSAVAHREPTVDSEKALWVTEAALWMFRQSSGLEGREKLNADWLVMCALERAVQLMESEQYGEA